MASTSQPRRLVPLLEVPEQPGYEWVTHRRLRRAVEQRTIPYFKAGPGKNARVLIDLNDLDGLVESGRHPSVAELEQVAR